MKRAVYNTTDNKFERCNDSATCKTTKKKTLAFHIHVNKVNKQKCSSASQYHRPMSVSACNNLYQTVNKSAYTENYKILQSFAFCQNNHLYYINPKK